MYIYIYLFIKEIYIYIFFPQALTVGFVYLFNDHEEFCHLSRVAIQISMCRVKQSNAKRQCGQLHSLAPCLALWVSASPCVFNIMTQQKYKWTLKLRWMSRPGSCHQHQRSRPCSARLLHHLFSNTDSLLCVCSVSLVVNVAVCLIPYGILHLGIPFPFL